MNLAPFPCLVRWKFSVIQACLFNMHTLSTVALEAMLLCLSDTLQDLLFL